MSEALIMKHHILPRISANTAGNYIVCWQTYQCMLGVSNLSVSKQTNLVFLNSQENVLIQGRF